MGAVENQRQKQLATLSDVALYANKKDNLFLLKQKQIFNKLYDKRFGKTNNLSYKFSRNDLNYVCKKFGFIIKFDDSVYQLIL